MDNDLKRSAKLVKKWLKIERVNVLDHKALISIKLNLFKMKMRVRARWPTNMARFHQFCKEKWANITANYRDMRNQNV